MFVLHKLLHSRSQDFFCSILTVDLSSWRDRIEAEIRGEDAVDARTAAFSDTDSIPDTSFKEHVSFKDGMLTIGCIGKSCARV